jgi:hypothetical protein
MDGNQSEAILTKSRIPSENTFPLRHQHAFIMMNLSQARTGNPVLSASSISKSSKKKYMPWIPYLACQTLPMRGQVYRALVILYKMHLLCILLYDNYHIGSVCQSLSRKLKILYDLSVILADLAQMRHWLYRN